MIWKNLSDYHILSSCFWKNGIGVRTAELSLISCQKYAMCHVCLWFMKKWLKKFIFFNSQHWKLIFWLAYSWNKNITKTSPWGLRPCWKRVTKSTNLRTPPPTYELGRYIVWWIYLGDMGYFRNLTRLLKTDLPHL